MALPFLRAAESRYEITIVCHPPVANLLRQATNNIQILEAPSSWLALAKMARDLRLTTTDAAACVWADARAHLLMLLSGAGVRAGFPMTRGNYYGANIPWRKRRLLFGKFLTTTTARLANSPLLTHPLHRKTSSQSHLDDWTQLTQSLGFEPDLTLPWITHREHHLLGPITEFLNKQTGRPVVVVHPGGRLTTKRWPYFQALLQTLAAGSDPAVLIVQPPGEEAPHPCSERQILTPTTDIPSLMALFHIVDAAICNDSFASHLAAAMGKPVVTIFGPAIRIGSHLFKTPKMSSPPMRVPSGPALTAVSCHP